MKTFYTSRINKSTLRKTVCIAAKKFGVNKTIFNNKGKFVRGTYNPLNNNIYLNLKQTKKELLGAFFHELGHHFAVKANKWKKYHFNLVSSMTVERAFQIENKIDKIAKKLWNTHVDLKAWGKYKYAYPKANKKQIMNHMIKTQ